MSVKFEIILHRSAFLSAVAEVSDLIFLYRDVALFLTCIYVYCFNSLLKGLLVRFRSYYLSVICSIYILYLLGMTAPAFL